MVIVLKDPSGIAEGITAASSILGQALQQRGQLKQREKERQEKQSRLGALQTAMQDVDFGTPEGQNTFLERALQIGEPDQALNIIKSQTALHKALQTSSFSIQDPEEIAALFSRLGVPPEQAEDWSQLYGSLSQGGKTQFATMLIDKMQRGEFGKPEEVAEIIEEASEEVPAYQFPEVDLFEGLLPKEKVKRQAELYTENTKDFKELRTKRKSLKNDAMRMSLLERYNNSGKLPEGMEKLNIDWKTGDIRFPALANAETQGFVKTINDFTVKAKETFGARVTNFELKAFMRRLPTLANSPEGRRIIIAQMKSMNELDRLEKDSLNEVYNQYGLRGIDAQKAEKIAEEMRAPEEEKLIQEVADSVEAQNIYMAKEVVPADKIVARDPTGKIVFIRANKADVAQEKGYELL